jgi:hypothetical protein
MKILRSIKSFTICGLNYKNSEKRVVLQNLLRLMIRKKMILNVMAENIIILMRGIKIPLF